MKKTSTIQIGDTISVPKELHGLEKQKNAVGEVIGIYPHIVTLRQKNGVKFSIFRDDFDNYQQRHIEIVSRAAGNMVQQLSDDILNNI